jgi:hypothetical protein
VQRVERAEPDRRGRLRRLHCKPSSHQGEHRAQRDAAT